ARRRTRIAAEEPPDLTLDLTAIQGPLGALDAPGKACQRLLDPRRKAFVHRLLLLAPIRRAAQEKSLGTLRARTHLHLDPLAHLLPILLGRDLALEAPQLAARRTNQVPTAPLP